jgi:predicted small integral membrane protein
VIEARILKFVMVGCLALFAAVVTFDNLVDYDANFEFVRHVLSMDTILPGNTLLYRQVTSPALWKGAYCLIIFGEGLTALTLALAAFLLTRDLRSTGGARFNRGKRFVFIGAAIGFLMWFFGFMVVGGEWFQMWQSRSWNGQEAAFRFYVTVLAVLIFVNQKDDDLATSEKSEGELSAIAAYMPPRSSMDIASGALQSSTHGEISNPRRYRHARQAGAVAG